MVRYPIVSGQFYANDFSKLSSQIEECFKKGPGMPSKRKTQQILAVIAPHAGYAYSGQTAAWAYKEIAESSLPDTFVILGTAHSGQPTSISFDDWETPISIVKNDKDFSNALHKKGIRHNDRYHVEEHSIEVQLPFLQIANKDRLKDIKITPVLVNETEGVAEKIRNTARELNKKITIIVSADFTHYGPNYGYVPFASNIKDSLYKLDKAAISKIIKLDVEGFHDYLKKTQATICGAKPLTVMMEYLRLVGMKSAKFLDYKTSGDIVGDFTNAVGYAAIAFY
ncbi:AmmeMemoRadiSam system protein B [Candidatus Woesearchaeota archaeon]|nr:AmmeMemoRadiSam system protein B [Candidatus Woesearchaeota archaeon]